MPAKRGVGAADDVEHDDVRREAAFLGERDTPTVGGPRGVEGASRSTREPYDNPRGDVHREYVLFGCAAPREGDPGAVRRPRGVEVLRTTGQPAAVTTVRRDREDDGSA